MFGMAMKFLELSLEPIIKATKSEENQNTSQNSNQQDQQKPKVKSTQIIKPSTLNDQNIEKKHENQSEVTLQQLKQSQQKVLEDFKKSIERSIAFSNHQSPVAKIQKPEGQPYDLVEGIVLSKIQQLSEEYLEYSMRKQLTAYQLHEKPQPGSLNLDSNHQKNKSSSCELIRSIVKSVLLPESLTVTELSQKLSFQGVHLKQSSVKRSQQDKNQKSLEAHYKTGSKNSIKSSQIKQPVTEFIKELFESLRLIQKDEKMSYSLKEMTETARKKFNSLRGNDYVEKLNEMLQSVEVIDHQRELFGTNIKVHKSGQLKNSSSAPITTSQNTPTVVEYAPVNLLESKQQSRKQILIKRPSDKKVKLFSPQTLSQLQSKRNKIQKQITDALEFLTISRRVRKFSFHSKDINEVILNFSYDFQFMAYKRVQNGFFTEEKLMKILKILCDCSRKTQKQSPESKQQRSASMIPLKWNLVNIAKGLKTKNFIKYDELLSNEKKKSQPLHEDRCFSLLFKNRTYDFECESSAIRDEYFRAIKIMIKSTCDL